MRPVYVFYYWEMKFSKFYTLFDNLFWKQYNYYKNQFLYYKEKKSK